MKKIRASVLLAVVFCLLLSAFSMASAEVSKSIVKPNSDADVWDVSFTGLDTYENYALIIIDGKDVEEITDLNDAIYINQGKSNGFGELSFTGFTPLSFLNGSVFLTGKNAPGKAERLWNIESVGRLGDADLNTTVNVIDARWILQYAATTRSLDSKQLKLSDVNDDGTVNVIDARWILQYAANLRNDDFTWKN